MEDVSVFIHIFFIKQQNKASTIKFKNTDELHRLVSSSLNTQSASCAAN